MEKDKRYKVVKLLVEAGHIIYFEEIFNYLPKSVLGLHLGINNNRMNKLKVHPDQFSLGDLHKIATLVETKPMLIVDLVFAQMEQSKLKQTKKGASKKTKAPASKVKRQTL
jgi:hypothetical protein